MKVNEIKYVEPDKYAANCTICNNKHVAWDFDGKIKNAKGSFPHTYCYKCRQNTPHLVKKVK